MKIYTNAQIKKALLLVNQGLTRKAAAKKAKIGVHSLNYYLSKKASPEIKKVILGRRYLKAIEVLKTLL